MEDRKSILSTRSRRSNAGNRLGGLIAAQLPVGPDEQDIFREFDDDEEFDVENAPQFVDENEDQEIGDGGEEGSGSDDEDSDGSVGSSNFSDSDESGIEDDAEPEDAGERELQKQQRATNREKRKADRKKLFHIKRRAPADEPDSEEPRRPRKRRELAPAESLLEGRRESRRRTAQLTKEHLLEQIREAERRKAQYVPPKVKNVPKLTQEQRLAEAKITEAKNLASLNKFVELEEERKVQQRLAMLGRRPKLTEFVRYHSATILVYPIPDETPKPLQYPNMHTPLQGPSGTVATIKQEHGMQPDAATQKTSEQHNTTRNENGVKESPQASEKPSEVTSEQKEPSQGPSEPKDISQAPSENKEQESLNNQSEHSNDPKTQQPNDSSNTSLTESEIKPVDNPSGEPNAPKDSSENVTTNAPKEEKDSQSNEDPSPSEPPNQTPVETSKSSPMLEGDQTQQKTQETGSLQEVDPSAGEQETPDQEKKPKDEPEAEEVLTYGPPAIKHVDIVTLHDFPPTTDMRNKAVVRGIVLGKHASKPSGPPPKRLCPFTGREARYIDPQSGVAYFNLETYRLIQKLRENEYSWSPELGGVFVSPRAGPIRHASGVPEGFE